MEMFKMNSAIFLDRDGVLYKEKNFFYLGDPLIKPEDFEWEKGAKEGLALLAELNFYLIMATNQSSMGRGLLDEKTFHKINNPIYKELSKKGRDFDLILFCPHDSKEGCVCRKPSTGMIEDAKRFLEIDLFNSYVVGDKSSDIQFGKNAGCKTVLLNTGYSGRDALYDAKPDFVFQDLYDFSKFLEKLK